MDGAARPSALRARSARASARPMPLDVLRERAERGEDAPVLLIVRAQLQTVALGYLERDLERVDRIEPETRAEQRRLGIDILRLDGFQIHCLDDQLRELTLCGRLA